MLTNADCTVYCIQPDGSYKRQYIKQCFWQPVDSAKVTNTAYVDADSAVLYIPPQEAQNAPKTVGKDIVVLGNCKLIQRNVTAGGTSDFLRTLREYDMHTVTAIERRLYGINAKHVKVVLK